MSFLKKLFGEKDERLALAPLYQAVVARAREPFWYAQGGVPDTLDGRFDMIAVILSTVLIRLESEGEKGMGPAALVTELFIDDMDGQLRQIGIGDIVVGKHVGKMMSALGGRLSAYREALTGGISLDAALTRNLYRGEAPEPAELALVEERLRGFHRALMASPFDRVIDGVLPQP
ncbi:ubiquinol-cytochrome C chaperone family protein [Flavisphingomonas formosensis]|uniref:ubiquinol-cytochrome C chaperone family protein n=1 Tax=Flavisphingomonas formosensis TaxID=861534 RepID=UPI0012FC7D77|nr:ubiquinol-cytochrome C chaperone family protein [Sphingomonas formosensis]